MIFPVHSAQAMMIPIIIRPMQIDDLEAVMEIDRLSFSLPWPRSAYEYELRENPAANLWVAEGSSADGGRRVVGMIVVWSILNEAHIATLAVHPDLRRARIGRRLLAHALRACFQKGARQAMLEVRAGNQAAQELYRRFGFESAGRRPRYYRNNNEDALLMNLKQLNQAYLDRLVEDDNHAEVKCES